MVPAVLTHLEDGILSNLQDRESRLLVASDAEKDLSLVWPQFAVWMLADEQWGMFQFVPDESKPPIQNVIGALKIMREGGEVSLEKWEELEKEVWALFVGIPAPFARAVFAANYACRVAGEPECACAFSQVGVMAFDSSEWFANKSSLPADSPKKCAQAQAEKFLRLLDQRK
jgi:hypothetical protein